MKNINKSPSILIEKMKSNEHEGKSVSCEGKLKSCIYCDTYYQVFHICEFMDKLENPNLSTTKNTTTVVKEENDIQKTKKSIVEVVNLNEDSSSSLFHKLQQQIDELKTKQTHLEKEVLTLRTLVQAKYKKNSIEHLNSTITPTMSPFFEWVSKIEITDNHLLCVIKNNLLQGMKFCVEDSLSKQSNIPIRVFKENPNTVFIYDYEEGKNQPKWQTCKKDFFENITYHISLKFMDKYIYWENKNDGDTSNNPLFKFYWNCNKNKQKQNEKEFATWFISKIVE